MAMIRTHVGRWLSAALVLLSVTPAAAQTEQAMPGMASTEPAAESKVGKVLHAYRIAGEEPRIDGALDDPAWRGAAAADGLIQWEPDNMAPLTERTVIRVAYDDRHIYVAVRCDDGDPTGIAGPLTRRDQAEQARTDLIAIGFDPRHDHANGYVFMTNPAGVQNDFIYYSDENTDTDYDAIWEVATARTPTGWTAEFRIPFSQIRFAAPASGAATWGFTVRRQIQRKGEHGEWTGRPRGERGNVSRWGHLVFDEPPTPPQRIELLPYVSARHESGVDDAAGALGAAGVDVRIGLGTSATLSATINPDFGQVELDPAVLNLSVFETFFSEKRPFFLEDSRTFVPPYGLVQVFHSRRIGRSPGRLASDVDGEITKRPDQTSVLGAVKLTGKASRWTYGTLSALTAREYADVTDGGVDARARIEPMTSYNVTRVQRDLFGGSSNIGAITSAVIRQDDTDAFAGGIDYRLRWSRNRNEWNGHWIVTRAHGNDGAVSDVGGVTNFNMTRKHWSVYTHFDHFGRDFRITDLGFLRARVNANQWNGTLSLEQPDPGPRVRRVSWSVSGGQSWNGDNLVFNRYANTNASVQLLNFWSVDGWVGRGFRVLDDLDTRGGPPIVRPADVGVEFSLGSDSRKTWRLWMYAGGNRDEAGGWSRRVGPSLSLQPSTRVQVSFGANYNAGLDVAQWVTNEDVTGDDVDDHVYGTLRRDVIDVTMRGSWALHRDLTLQVYLQPFVAVGDYRDIRRLARPRSFDFEPTRLETDPDFNNKSLRGNVVLRWEYQRGSTLFVAWNMSRSDDARPGQFAPWRDLAGSFAGQGPQTLMVKLNYWLSR